MRRLMIAATMLAAACAPKADDLGAAAGDEATPADSMRVDSVRADSARPDGDSLPAVTMSSKAVQGRDSILGRDSAFGPRFKVDSTGKLTPIKRP